MRRNTTVITWRPAAGAYTRATRRIQKGNDPPPVPAGALHRKGSRKGRRRAEATRAPAITALPAALLLPGLNGPAYTPVYPLVYE